MGWEGAGSSPSREQALECWPCFGKVLQGMSPNRVSPFAKLGNETAQGKEHPSQDKDTQPVRQPAVICRVSEVQSSVLGYRVDSKGV